MLVVVVLNMSQTMLTPFHQEVESISSPFQCSLSDLFVTKKMQRKWVHVTSEASSQNVIHFRLVSLDAQFEALSYT